MHVTVKHRLRPMGSVDLHCPHHCRVEFGAIRVDLRRDDFATTVEPGQHTLRCIEGDIELRDPVVEVGSQLPNILANGCPQKAACNLARLSTTCSACSRESVGIGLSRTGRHA